MHQCVTSHWLGDDLSPVWCWTVTWAKWRLINKWTQKQSLVKVNQDIFAFVLSYTVFDMSGVFIQHWILTHWGRDEMDNNSQTTFSNVFSSMKMFVQISLKLASRDLIKNIPALVQIMDWRRPGDKPLSETMMVSIPTHICVTRPQGFKQCRAHPWCFVPVYPKNCHSHSHCLGRNNRMRSL